MGIVEQGRANAERQFAEYSFVERKNAYECDDPKGCGSYIVTVDRHPGVTPFMLKCGNCGGYAHSKMYRVQPDLVPTHEWYRPDKDSDVPQSARDHVAKGGLVLRPIGDGKWINPHCVAYIDAPDIANHARAIELLKQEMARKIGIAEMAAREDEMKRESDNPIDRAKFASRQAWPTAKRGK